MKITREFQPFLVCNRWILLAQKCLIMVRLYEGIQIFKLLLVDITGIVKV